MNSTEDKWTFKKECNYHEDFFTEKKFRSNHQKQVLKYLGEKKINLFYPGTGPDIYVPMKYLSNIVDEFYFNDNDLVFEKEILSDSFKEYIKFNGFQILNCGQESVDGLSKTWYVLEYNGKKIKFNYFHCDWYKLLDWFNKNNIKISFLYLYGIGGEGGSNFMDIYDIHFNDWKSLTCLSEISVTMFEAL